MKITYFFRKPNPRFYSIEGLFENLQKALPNSFQFKNWYVKHGGRSILGRMFDCIFAINQQGDVNHITGDIHYISFFLKKGKTILTIHDIETLRRGGCLRKWIVKILWFVIPSKRVEFVTVISEFTKQELKKIIKIDSGKVKVVSDCVSPRFVYSPKTFNEKKPILLQLGTKMNKNLENLVEAIRGIDCRLIVVGFLSRFQKELLRGSRLDYVNYFNISEDQIIDLYKKADLVTFVSTYEGFGLPILEANATGRPVITSNLASMPEVGSDAAYYVDPYNIEEIRDGILRLISDSELRRWLIQNGLENVKRFTPERIASEYYKLYKEVYKENQKSSRNMCATEQINNSTDQHCLKS